MEYATQIGIPNTSPQALDMGFSKYIGWQDTIKDSPSFNMMFTAQRMHQYQKKISELLQGVGPDNRPIIVPFKTISSVLWECYESNTPVVGSIYSRLQQPSNRDDTTGIVDRMINIIVSQIRTEYGMVEQNKKLTIWSTLLGDFNKEGIRAHPPIKLRKKRTQRMMFNMNY